MDYGQTNKKNEIEAFFTAGSGAMSPNQSYSAPEDNLDLTHQPAWTWPGATDKQDGMWLNQSMHQAQSEALSAKSNEPSMQTEESFVQTEEPSISSEQTIYQDWSEQLQLEGPEEPEQITKEQSLPERQPQESSVSANKEVQMPQQHITVKSAISDVEQAIEKLNQTGDIATFYTTIRGSNGALGAAKDSSLVSRDGGVI